VVAVAAPAAVAEYRKPVHLLELVVREEARMAQAEMVRPRGQVEVELYIHMALQVAAGVGGQLEEQVITIMHTLQREVF
jgi:hypothetical protein